MKTRKTDKKYTYFAVLTNDTVARIKELDFYDFPNNEFGYMKGHYKDEEEIEIYINPANVLYVYCKEEKNS